MLLLNCWHQCMQTQQAVALASSLGLQPVGFLFSQSAGAKEYIMNDAEVALACAASAKVGEHCVIAVFSQLEEDGQVRCRLFDNHCTGNQLLAL